ncbi:MAG: hypothetical protein P8X73_02260 [Ignavibacteriaceae bacterium]|jgi:hypothetical protein
MINEIKSGKSLNEIEKVKYVSDFEQVTEMYENEKNKNFKSTYEEYNNV